LSIAELLSESVYGRPDLAEAIDTLVNAGALFALAQGSQVTGMCHAQSDLDLPAYFGSQVPLSCDVLLPAGIDLTDE